MDGWKGREAISVGTDGGGGKKSEGGCCVM